MNILVIGGSNFIGWRFVKILGTTSHTVTVINRGNHKRVYPGNITHRTADRNDYDEMLAAIGDTTYDAVFDMCGFVESDMQHIVKLFAKRAKKYVFISSAATYIEPLEMPIAEDYAQGSHHVWGKYGSGKLACERVLLKAHKQAGFPAVIVRPSYVYGIGNNIDRETFLFDRITKGRAILIPGDGQAVLQLGEVSDLCHGLLCIAEAAKGYGECYNISGGQIITLDGLVALVAQIMGKRYTFAHVQPKDYGMTDRHVFPFDNVSYVTNCRKFTNDFGWAPEVLLAEGLSAAYKEWLHSPDRPKTSYDNEDIVLAKQAIG